MIPVCDAGKETSIQALFVRITKVQNNVTCNQKAVNHLKPSGNFTYRQV
jgi:hypothetical protein